MYDDVMYMRYVRMCNNMQNIYLYYIDYILIIVNNYFREIKNITFI
jgi:hypothetical protein